MGEKWSSSTSSRRGKGDEENREQQIGYVFLFRHELLLWIALQSNIVKQPLLHGDFLIHFSIKLSYFQTRTALRSIRTSLITIYMLFLMPSFLCFFCFDSFLFFLICHHFILVFSYYILPWSLYSLCLLIRPLHMQFKLPICQLILDSSKFTFIL